MPDDKPRWDLNTKRGRLEHAIYRQIGYYKRGARDNEARTLTYRKILIVLAAATTIAVGLQISGWDTILKNIALVFSALATAIATFDSYVDHRGKWILRQEVYLELLNLKARYNFMMAETATPDQVVDSHWSELQDILDRAHKNRIEGLAEVGGE